MTSSVKASSEQPSIEHRNKEEKPLRPGTEKHKSTKDKENKDKDVAKT